MQCLPVESLAQNSGPRKGQRALVALLCAEACSVFAFVVSRNADERPRTNELKHAGTKFGYDSDKTLMSSGRVLGQ